MLDFISRLPLPRSLRRQFTLALLALMLLIVAAGLLAVRTLQVASENTRQLAGERLARAEKAQEIERLALSIERESARSPSPERSGDVHAGYAQITGRLGELDRLVDELAASSDDVAILSLHEASQLFRNTSHVVASLHERALHDRQVSPHEFDDDLKRQALAMSEAAQEVSRQYAEDYRLAVEALAQTAQRDQLRVLALLGGSLLLAWLVSHFFLGRRVIARLREVSHHLRRGDIDGPALVPVRGGDEIAEMARAVEQFLDDRKRLAEANAALKAERAQQEELIGKLAQAQTQLLQSEKMASIGQLAAGVAHEINNPIGFVNSNVGTLTRYITQLLEAIAAYEAAEPKLSAERRASLAEVKQRVDLAFMREDVTNLIAESAEGLQRVTRIIQDLKDFAHVDEAETQWADLERGLDSTLNVAWNEIKYKAEVVKQYGGIPEVECIPSQINQVFMNLLVNAAQAIPERGTITLRTALEGDRVSIEIADTGRGIPPEHLQRIFDPFFTTKPVGKGTGLGLSLAYGIVQKHGGSIEVSSEPGRGTTFRMTLPIEASDALRAKAAREVVPSKTE
ncbi:MAG: HAMP domain-containing protein [Gammaproteobacteria bacterium]|nr:HAMP domain-containing protein [Gammaproteobacteria bacterium]MBU1416292.1 HAMP domain-containing protein [Gammaproteobacteria bacterium]